MEAFCVTLDWIYHLIWDGPLLVLLMGLGLFLTFALRGIQFRHLGYSLRLALFPQKSEEKGEGDISHFQSLMTALAATIGIGNIAGVATAVTVGGLGALFWMWCMALVGMAIKYSEAILAIRYRAKDKNGQMCGGPMYFIERGLGWKPLAVGFAACGLLSGLGGGNMIQANSVADVLHSTLGLDPRLTGLGLAVLTALTLAGGIKGIGKVASYLVPFMAVIYLIGGLAVLFVKIDLVPRAFSLIFSSAFHGQAAVGGFAGSSMWLAFQMGMSRGLCSSEAGLGTASIAAAAAKTDTPGRQALVSMSGAFISTIVMCTITGLVIAVAGVLGGHTADGAVLDGATLTVAAFDSVIPGGGYIVTVGLVFFAFSTILGWGYYGEKCVEYLFHERSIGIFRILFSLAVIPGAVMDLAVVWRIADVTNALMAIPNLIGVLMLSGIVVQETRIFEDILKRERGVTAQPSTQV